MNVSRTFLVLWLVAIAALPLAAQQPVCAPGFPAESPVVSNSPDDIPATNVDIVNHNFQFVKARANHNMAFVEIGPNEQRVYFGVDANPSLERVFYNRRVRDTTTGQWTWRYPYSPEVIRYPDPTSGGAASVLYSATAKYRDAATNTLYKYVMYQVVQPGLCDGVVAGFVYYSFSNNGICWTTPRPAQRPGGPSFNCSSTITNSVPVEAVSAIDAGDTIYLVGIEGDISNQLAPPVTVLDPNGQPRRYNNMNRTMTALGSASTSDPRTITILGSLSAAGMFLPNYGPANPANPERYKSHAYFINMDIAWDPTTGNFYISRAYPYAYDRGSLVPIGRNDPPSANNSPLRAQVDEANTVWAMGPHGASPVVSCIDSPGTLPNRVQIYRMNIGSLANITQITTGTWTLVTDVGGGAGYSFDSLGGATTPLLAGMTNINRDVGAASFLRNRRGELVRYGTTSYYFVADTFKKQKSVGPCQITGLEREFVRVLP
ncbi:MAG TPA: hypothetical protein VHK90_07565 [Thermoanaerobaculia bacterium]|nr:hypothetical protein [Thermoanaerobaculia bacterium]